MLVGEFPPSQPGQFIQLLCRPICDQADLLEVDFSADRPPKFTQPELIDHEPLLRRPLSLAGQDTGPDGRDRLFVIYRAIGTGTTWLGGVRPGQTLSVLGPLGNGFEIDPDVPMAVLVGGGVGIPPMIYLASALAAAGKEVVVFSGVQTAELLPLTLVDGQEVSSAGVPTACVEQFAASGALSVIATDDGSLGVKGFITDALADWLADRDLTGKDVVVYSCGPEAMMKSAGDVCQGRSIRCQLAMERHMACGMGTCQSCVVKIRDASEAGWSFKLCCSDGPVFDSHDIIWR